MAEYIEREAVLVELDRREKLMVGDKTVSIDAIKSFFKNRPTADVAPVVHGRWISHRDYLGEISGYYLCSVCKKLSSHKHDFCPNCGAKMGGGADNATD